MKLKRMLYSKSPHYGSELEKKCQLPIKSCFLTVFLIALLPALTKGLNRLSLIGSSVCIQRPRLRAYYFVNQEMNAFTLGKKVWIISLRMDLE